jgi:hypothetical protein
MYTSVEYSDTGSLVSTLREPLEHWCQTAEYFGVECFGYVAGDVPMFSAYGTPLALGTDILYTNIGDEHNVLEDFSGAINPNTVISIHTHPRHEGRGGPRYSPPSRQDIQAELRRGSKHALVAHRSGVYVITITSANRRAWINFGLYEDKVNDGSTLHHRVHSAPRLVAHAGIFSSAARPTKIGMKRSNL